jgi:hypothetical protein
VHSVNFNVVIIYLVARIEVLVFFLKLGFLRKKQKIILLLASDLDKIKE